MTKMIRKTIDVHKKQPKSSKYVNIRLLDATTDSDIEKHIAEDDAAALFDAAEFAKSNKIDLTSKDVIGIICQQFFAKTLPCQLETSYSQTIKH